MASNSSSTVYDEQRDEPSSSIEMQINADVNQTTARNLLREYALDDKDKWEEARVIFENFPEMVSTPLTLRSRDTALHLAVIAEKTGFVRKLVNSGLFTRQRDYLLTRNADGVTAFCMAAILGHGDAEFFKTMIRKSPNLPLLANNDSMLPVHLAAFNGHHNIVKILISDDVMNLQGEHTYEDNDIKRLFFMTIRNNMYDVAAKLLDKDQNKNLATAREGPDNQKLTALHMLARESSQKYHKKMKNDGLVENLWRQVRRLEHTRSLELINEPSIVLFDAVKSGNSYVLQYILFLNPELGNIKDPNGQNILHLAALYRRQNDFSFILSKKISKPLKFVVDKNHDNVLHFAAHYRDETSSSMKPTIIQMQKQREWFKEVQNHVPPELMTMKNMEDKTPMDVLRTNQEKLLEQLKYSPIRIANSSMLVAALIATITFAAILTAPGDKSNGTLIEVPSDDDQSNGWFIVFILTNALAVLSSSASIVSFLSVLNSRRFTDNHSANLLHPWLIGGLVLLFISITAMVMALVAALFLIFAHNSKGVAYSVALLAPLPILLFLVFHTRILNDHGYSFVDVIRICMWLEIKGFAGQNTANGPQNA